MDLTDYTTYEDVRMALGVSDEELEDADLAVESVMTNLEVDLDQAEPLLLTTYNSLPEPDARTPKQAKFGKLLRLYAGYAVAYRQIDTIKMRAFKKLTDGRATAERVDDAMADLEARMGLQLSRILALLLAALADLLGTPVTTPVREGLNVSSNIGLAADPVTG